MAPGGCPDSFVSGLSVPFLPLMMWGPRAEGARAGVPWHPVTDPISRWPWTEMWAKVGTNPTREGTMPRRVWSLRKVNYLTLFSWVFTRTLFVDMWHILLGVLWDTNLGTNLDLGFSFLAPSQNELRVLKHTNTSPLPHFFPPTVLGWCSHIGIVFKSSGV